MGQVIVLRLPDFVDDPPSRVLRVMQKLIKDVPGERSHLVSQRQKPCVKCDPVALNKELRQCDVHQYPPVTLAVLSLMLKHIFSSREQLPQHPNMIPREILYGSTSEKGQRPLNVILQDL